MCTRGDHSSPTIIVKDVTSYDIWICHVYFGFVGSNNDINVLKNFPLFDDIVEGWTPSSNYTINSKNYNIGYYLTYDIYLE